MSDGRSILPLRPIAGAAARVVPVEGAVFRSA
jgi:hypothetical protein